MHTDVFTRYPVLVLPGWQDSLAGHWQTLWEKRFGWKRIQQKDWERPKKQDWVAGIKAAVHAEKDPVVIITHSLGGPALVHAVVNDREMPIRGAFIVAPPDLERPDLPPPLHDFRPTPLFPLPFPAQVLASANDHYIDVQRARYFAGHWGAKLIQVGKHGHINPESGMGPWEQGLELFGKFVDSLD